MKRAETTDSVILVTSKLVKKHNTFQIAHRVVASDMTSVSRPQPLTLQTLTLGTTIVDVSEPVTVKPTNTITSVVTFTPIISVTVTSTNSEDPPEFIAPTQTQESTPASTTLGISAPTTSPSNPLIPSSTGSTLKTSARPSVTSATSNASSQVTSSASTTSSETSTPTEQAASSGRGKSKGPVIGGAIGAIAFLVLLGVFIWWYKRRQAKARKPRIVAGYRAGDGEISKPAETGLARADSTPSRSWVTTPSAYEGKNYEMSPISPPSRMSESTAGGFMSIVPESTEYTAYSKPPPTPPPTSIKWVEPQSRFAQRTPTPNNGSSAVPYPMSEASQDDTTIMPSTIGSIGSQRSGTPSRPARPKSLTPHDIETANSLAGASSQPYDYYGSEHDYREEERDTLGEFPQSRYVSMSAASTAGGFTASINEALNNAPAYNNIPLSTRPSLTDPDLPLRELSPSPLNVVKRSPSDPEPNNGESSSKPPSTPYILGIFGDPNTGIKEEPERMSVDVWQERDKAFHALSGEERRLTRPPPTRPPPAARYTTASSVYSRLLDGVTPMHQVYNPTRLATPPIDQKARQMQEDMARMAELEKKRDALGFTTSDMHGEPANHELEPPPKTYF